MQLRRSMANIPLTLPPSPSSVLPSAFTSAANGILFAAHRICLPPRSADEARRRFPRMFCKLISAWGDERSLPDADSDGTAWRGGFGHHNHNSKHNMRARDRKTRESEGKEGEIFAFCAGTDADGCVGPTDGRTGRSGGVAEWRSQRSFSSFSFTPKLSPREKKRIRRKEFLSGPH